MFRNDSLVRSAPWLLLVLPGIAESQTVTFRQGSEYGGCFDTSLYSEPPNDSFSFCTDNLVAIDFSTLKQGLIRFEDIFGNAPGQIPLGATIVNATLTLDVPNQGQISTTLHRVLLPWDPCDSWNDWGSNGVQTDDIEAKMGPDSFISSTLVSSLMVDITPSLRAWSNGEANYGWVLIPGSESADGWEFVSADHATESRRPLLEVTFVLPAPCDDFEDGLLDLSRWTPGGNPDRGVGGGQWQFGHTESNGCLSIRVWGPTSGLSHGAEGWVRTNYDYNNGQNHMVNFRWGADVNASHVDMYAIQITDGTIPGGTDLFWYGDSGGEIDGPGWKNLYSRSNQTDMGPMDWSILIDAATATATLFDGPVLSGQIIGQKVLPTDQTWFVRFILSDGTSAGFPEGDNTLSLCEFCSTVAADCNTNSVPDALDIRHNCCQTGHGAGCSFEPIESCVCDADRYCCLVAWDEACVERVTSGECGPCDIDCNSNAVPDECDIADGASQDCQPDRIPDECQAGGNDCDANGVPDECQPDLDADGLIDDCDPDIDNDGVSNESDECDNTPVGRAVDPAGHPLGDIDRDCDTDMVDYGFFLQGFTGPLEGE